MKQAEETQQAASEGVEIESSQLSAEALRGIAEEFVTREGTDYGPWKRGSGRATEEATCSGDGFRAAEPDDAAARTPNGRSRTRSPRCYRQLEDGDREDRLRSREAQTRQHASRQD